MLDGDEFFFQSAQRENMVDHFPSLALHRAKGLVHQSEVERRLLEQPAKPLQRIAFGDPHRRFAIVEPFALHDQDRAEQVFAGERRLAPSRRRRVAELFEIAMHDIKDLRMPIKNFAEHLVFVAIFTYDLVLRLVISGPKIKNRFGFFTHRYPP